MPQVKAIGKRICEVLTRKQQKYHNVATSMTNKGMDWNIVAGMGHTIAS